MGGTPTLTFSMCKVNGKIAAEVALMVDKMISITFVGKFYTPSSEISAGPKESPEKNQVFLRQLLLYVQHFSLYHIEIKFPILPSPPPLSHAKTPHLHASEFYARQFF